MRGKQGNIHIGTSGWSYQHWLGVFYPQELKSSDWLVYYSKYFQTVEINSCFYHLPKETSFVSWEEKTPSNFLFSLKVWRRITHFKKLKDIKNDLKIFLHRSKGLGHKFGPLLFQFPPNFNLNLDRLESLAKLLRKFDKRQSAAFEFRHQNWFQPEVYRVLSRYNLALCWADTPIYPYVEEVTADYIYFRLHGHEQLYSSKYTKKQLGKIAKKTKKLLGQGKDVYVYFDNDAAGYAVENAQELKRMIKND
ncbi:DUF72 domain-containing protein [Patescibacteria group bacterium]|nr:DUF72 domain-containing protein [Patescibacteria group bacterium]